MKSRTTIGLLQAITTTLIFLFLMYQQAESIGFSEQQKTARLTTFGNQNAGSRNQSTPHHVQISGKECRSNIDCAGIANTTCMKHPDDTKLRCLCGEKKSPLNGACHHSKQGLHLKCNEDEDCISGATCKTPTNSSASSNIARTCECKEDFAEDDYECSRGILTTVPCTDAAFLLLFYPLLQLMH
ncbi:uncharacterized protein LOC110840525 [Zootermopsis nevadensis]|uniref:uncharacterized protein LOC110840525 n=1 Tax=Zootermopsis nevadensis TaxID=136037 RepID=UPI000B8EE778|nr:uncharacterized protein LOC110840525 [Zootermopsis nevadensis]